MSAVRHVVLMRFRAELDGANRVVLLNDLAELVAQLVECSPGLIAGTVGADAGLSAGAADAALVLDAVDVDAWRAYQQDQRHQAFVGTRLGPALAERTAIQFEIAGR